MTETETKTNKVVLQLDPSLKKEKLPSESSLPQILKKNLVGEDFYALGDKEKHETSMTIEAHSPITDKLIVPRIGNALVGAVHLSFASHYPLILSAEDIWICICQGFAHHISNKPEKYRKKFASFDGKKKLIVRRDNFVKGSAENDWPGVFSDFSTQIQDNIGKDAYQMIISEFSTTTPLSKAISEIVLMDTVKNHFEYGLMTKCGIPEVHLEGTLADWQLLKQKAQKFSKFDLDWWIKELNPVLDKIIASVKSKSVQDKDFWSSIYKLKSASGGPYVTGWINVFFPYLKTEAGGSYEKNNAVTSWKDGLTQTFEGGPQPNRFPSSMCQVPFEWNYLGKIIPMEFLGGFISPVLTDTEEIKPQLAWVILDEAEIPKREMKKGKF